MSLVGDIWIVSALVPGLGLALCLYCTTVGHRQYADKLIMPSNVVVRKWQKDAVYYTNQHFSSPCNALDVSPFPIYLH